MLERIEIRGLKWFDENHSHLMRIKQERFSQKLFKWILPGKKKQERLRRLLNEGMQQAMKNHELTAENAIGIDDDWE